MKNIIILGLIGCLLAAPLGYCQLFADYSEEEITMIVKQTVSIPAWSPTKVGVADPAIADIVTVGDKEVVLIGKARGRTNFFLNDSTGEHTFNIQVVPEDMEHLLERIQAIIDDVGLKGLVLKPVEDQGKVLLIGNVRTVEEKEQLQSALGELTSKVTNLIQVEQAGLVEIAIEVVELTQGASQTLGFTVPRGVVVTETGTLHTSTQAHPWGVFNTGPFTRTSGLTFELDLLQSEGQATILARPRLLCQSGKEAEFLVGGEVPLYSITIGTSGTETVNVEYKDYGIKMKISPTLTPTERIQLGVDIEISELDDSHSVGLEGGSPVVAYAVKTRDVSTSLHLNDGETMVIGGLIRKVTSEDITKFPWLSDIPILGKFFTHRTATTGGGTKGDTELFIALTPRVVYNSLPQGPEEKLVQAQAEEFSGMYEGKDIPVELQDYVLEIQRNILTHISYPTVLIGTGWQGDVLLKLNINQTGELKEVQILKASGYKIFDEQAIKLVKSLRYAPFPFDAPLEELKIEVPIVYRESN